MPNAAVMNTSGGTAQSTTGRGQAQAPAAVKPFYRASMEHRESAGIDKTITMTTSDQDMGSFGIPAYGYLRSLLVVVSITGGVAGTAFQPDAPFNVLKNITVSEPNGAVLFQANSGYDLYLINKYGAYRSGVANDPRSDPFFTTSLPNATMIFRIPVGETRNRDSLGSLPNQNASAQFNLRLTVAGSGTVYTSTPTTQPNVRIRVFAEEYDQPALTSDGSANQTVPPAVNTTQYWSPQVFPVVAGANTIRLTRVGNYIRNLIFVYRDATGARVTMASNNWPDISQLFYDTRPVDTIQADIWRKQVFERYNYGGRAIAVEAAAGLDNGVFPYDFCHEFLLLAGNELNDGWLPTLSSTRLEIQGTFGVAGTLTVLTNDVSVAGNVFIG